MKPILERGVDPRVDEFANTEDVRQRLAQIGADDCGLFFLLTEYDFKAEARHFCSQGGLMSFLDQEIAEVAKLFKEFYVEDEKLEDEKWEKGLDLVAKVISFLKPLKLDKPGAFNSLNTKERWTKYHKLIFRED